MIDDATLLRRYAHEHAQDAFAELVRRHLDLVYSAALRRTGGDAHRAADIAQVVFARLAHDAAALASHAVLAGWLYTATRNAALNTLRTEERRRAREQEAYRMQEISSPPEPDADWQQLRPVLDAAMDELDERDREAVLVRFFQGRPFAEVAAVLRVSEDAARKRVERALEKLRDRLARRGITSTAGLLAGVLSQQAVSAAPAAVASAVASAGAVALTGAGAVSAGAEIMAMFTKTKLAALGAAAILGIGWHYTAVARLDRQYVADEARQETMLATERAEHRRLLASSPPPVGEIGRVAAAPMPAEETLDPLMRTRAAMAIVKEGGLGQLRWRPFHISQSIDFAPLAELLALTPPEVGVLQQAADRAREEIVAAGLAGASIQRNGNEFAIEVRESAAAQASYDRLRATLQVTLGAERYGYFEQIGCAEGVEQLFKKLGLATITYIVTRVPERRRPNVQYELTQRLAHAGLGGSESGFPDRPTMLLNLGPFATLVPPDL